MTLETLAKMQKQQNEGDAFIALDTLLYKSLFGLQTFSQVQSVKTNIVLINLVFEFSRSDKQHTVQNTMMIEKRKKLGKKKKDKLLPC